MASLNDQQVRTLLEQPNCAVISTVNEDGSILSTVVWVNAEDGALAVNSAVGRRWPTNLQRDPRVTVLVYAADNPYEYVEVRGSAAAARERADEHIDTLTKKYINQDKYPFRAPGEERIKFVIAPEHVRYQKQG
jgi:PPOX class probable F420-dependent enzyme